MKKLSAIFISLICFLGILFGNFVYASSNTNNGSESNEIIAESTKSKLVEIKDTELKSIADYTEVYGSPVYGTVGYILNKVRVYSIPIAFLGIVVSAIYEFIMGNRHLEDRQKGFNGMITVVALFIICQVLPLVFAIVIKGWRE